MRDHTRKHHFHEQHFHEHHFHGHDAQEERHHPEAGQGRGHGPRGGGHGHGRSHGPFGGNSGGGNFGGPRGRARRGEARYILLDALKDGPKHGYEIIKALEERSGGQYAPSPGTVYPTMQYLEDMGLVRADQGAERRVFSLTDAGQADLEAHASEIAEFWARFGNASASPAQEAEIGFLREDLDALTRTVWDGLRSANDLEAVRQVRATLTRCRDEVRAIIANVPAPENQQRGVNGEH